MQHVFLSYSSKDIVYARMLENELESNDYNVWRDQSELRGGQQWQSMIEEALRNAWAVIVLQTVDSKQSPWVVEEIEFAKQRKLPIIPVLLNGDPWFGFLGTQFIDVRGMEDQPLPDTLYNALLNFAPVGVLDEDIDTQLIKSNTPERVGLVPTLETIARNPKSPRGRVAHQILTQLSRDSDEYVKSAAQIALKRLSDLMPRQEHPAKPVTPSTYPSALAQPGSKLPVVPLLVGLAVIALIAAGIFLASSGDDKKDNKVAQSTLTPTATSEPATPTPEAPQATAEVSPSITPAPISERPTEEILPQPTEEILPQVTEEAYPNASINEDFNDGRAQGFSVGRGNWQAETLEDGNVVYMSDNRDKETYSNLDFGDPRWRNYTAEYKVRILEDSGGAPTVALMFRSSCAATCAEYIHHFDPFNQINGLEINIGNEGWQPLMGASANISKDVWYTIRVSVVDASIQIYVNDELIIDYQDTQISQGKLSISAGPGSYVQIDDVSVTDIES